MRADCGEFVNQNAVDHISWDLKSPRLSKALSQGPTRVRAITGWSPLPYWRIVLKPLLWEGCGPGALASYVESVLR